MAGWRRVIASIAVENGSARSAGSGPSGYFFFRRRRRRAFVHFALKCEVSTRVNKLTFCSCATPDSHSPISLIYWRHRRAQPSLSYIPSCDPSWRRSRETIRPNRVHTPRFTACRPRKLLRRLNAQSQFRRWINQFSQPYQTQHTTLTK